VKARTHLKELVLINGLKVDHPATSAFGGPGGKDLPDCESIAFDLACRGEWMATSVDIGEGEAGWPEMDFAGKSKLEQSEGWLGRLAEEFSGGGEY
jgi:hypothetical protein